MLPAYAPTPLFPESDLIDLLRHVEELGEMLVERQTGISFTYKADGSLLSALDVEVQRKIRDCVRRTGPERARQAHFVGEEDEPGEDVSRLLAPGRWNWIVDAIDGTAAFVKGSNSFAIEIALVDEKHRPILGMIHLPAWQRRFYVAWEGELFHWGQGRLTPAGASTLPAEWRDRAAAPVARSYLYGNSDLHRRGLDTFRGKVRNLGGTAAHLALLADRSVDPIAVVVSRCEVWDVAGGLALAEAAGLEVRRGADWSRVTAAEIIGAPRISAMLPIVAGLPEALRVLEPELRGRLR
ncbi:MAG: hypothetical protein H6509_06735 [Bryobacterales bacterium]|nr:hypothetical protein [Acidobacteriota bacterium]MCB9384292.1 hypothetical protein [Bryobacterales bacterium]